MTKQEQFFRALAKLVQPDDPEAAYQAFQPMMSMLTHTPDRVWQSRMCLEAIATAKRRTIIPGYGDILAAIGQWCRDNPEATLAIGDERKAGWTQRDHSWLAYYEKRERENFMPRGKRNLLSLLREQCPAVVRYLGQ